MFCMYCGKPLADNTKFCTSCGNPVPVRATKSISDSHESKKEAFPKKLAVLLIVCSLVSVLGYLLHTYSYSHLMLDLESELLQYYGVSKYPFDLTFFSFWIMTLPALAGCGLIVILHFTNKVIKERISTAAYVIPIAAFIWIYGFNIIAATICYRWIGSMATAAYYISTLCIDTFGFVWPWLMLGCYLISKPSAKTKRNRALVIAAAVMLGVVLFAIILKIYPIIAEAAGLNYFRSTSFDQIQGLLSCIPVLVLMYMSWLAACGKIRVFHLLVSFIVMFIVAALLSVVFVVFLHIGSNGLYFAEIIAYLITAVILFSFSRQNKQPR